MNIFALALEYLWLGISQICWIQIIDWNNGLITVESTPISIWIILWGTKDFSLGRQSSRLKISLLMSPGFYPVENTHC